MFQIRFVFVVAIVGAVLRFELRLHAVGGLSRRPRGLEEGNCKSWATNWRRRRRLTVFALNTKCRARRFADPALSPRH